MKIKLKNWLSILGFILLMLAILYGGPRLSKWLDNRYRERIDKNPLLVKAVVIRKSAHKGKSVYFSYSFNGETYRNNEQNDCLFYSLNTGDTIDIRIDITEPENSYVVKPDCSTGNE
ncbi:MAG: hypothetical protein J7527_15965 [Chitinophagaceae bacterium]|nr:hypothetical protein [Chitinophagaceae bacterium]